MIYCLNMCCHSSFEVIPPCFTPIQCGAALKPRIPGTIRDDEGDNISWLNTEYCELTAHYYAWKNIDADWYGFCHYRRFFALDSDTRLPYIVCGNPTNRDVSFLGSSMQLEKLIENYEVIAPRPENMGMSARKHYCTSSYHFAEDLDLFIKLLRSAAPQLTETADEYLAQNKQYFCNMFIMKRENFQEYCNILFSVLKEFDLNKKRHGSFNADRTDGYLGEIFTGIYITWAKKKGISVAEVPRLDAGCTLKKRLGYKLLPPESKVRFAIKRIIKRM